MENLDMFLDNILISMQNTEEEIWKSIPSTDNKYSVSNYGNVKHISCGFIKKEKHECGYMVNIKIKGFYRKMLVSKLVASMFLKNKYNFNYVVHKDNDQYNDFYKNLMWGKLKKYEITQILIKFNKGVSLTKLARDYKVSKDTIESIINVSKIAKNSYSGEIVSNSFIQNIEYKYIKGYYKKYIICETGDVYEYDKMYKIFNKIKQVSEDNEQYVYLNNRRFKVAELVAINFIKADFDSNIILSLKYLDNDSTNVHYMNLEVEFKRKQRKIDDGIKNKVIYLYTHNFNINDISAKTDLPKTTIYHVLKQSRNKRVI